MKLQGIFLIWAGLLSSSAFADEQSLKSDLTVTTIEKNSSQIVFHTSSGDGKGDLLRESDNQLFIHPASSGPFPMLPDDSIKNVDRTCALSSVTPQQAQDIVSNVAKTENVDPELALAIASAESGFNVNAVSEDGAFGLMQLMPGTASDLQVDRCDPQDNARGGVRYIKSLMTQFGNPVFALAAYNAGPENVRKHKGVPPFAETVQYIARVLSTYYGAPEQLQGNKQIAAMTPAKKIKKSGGDANFIPLSTTPDKNVWASGFVMHFN